MPAPPQQHPTWQGGISSYNPSWREKVAYTLADNLGGLGNTRAGNRRARYLTAALEMIPFVGGAPSVDDAARSAERGDYLGAGFDLAMAGLPGPPIKKGIRAFQGSPHNFAAERLVRHPGGREEFIVGQPDVLPDVPPGAEVVQDYPLGRVRLDKIGTGEGAQAYGHGAYVAEHEGVARGYRDKLTIDPRDALNDVIKQLSKEGPDALHPAVVRSYINQDPNLQGLGDNSEIVDTVRVAAGGQMPDGTVSNDALRAYRYLDKIMPVKKGHMYEVEINADPEQFLDWDKPLSEQPESVRKAIGLDRLPQKPTPEEAQAVFALAKERGVPAHTLPEYKALEARLDSTRQSQWDVLGIDPPNVPMAPEELQASTYYQGLIGKKTGPVQIGTPENQGVASQELAKRGIPGIKYLDQGSRLNPAFLPKGNPMADEARDFLMQANGDPDAALKLFRSSNPHERWATTERDEIAKVIQSARSQSRNYVVFDDKLLDIKRKYGISGLLAAMGLAGAAGYTDDAQAQTPQTQGGW